MAVDVLSDYLASRKVLVDEAIERFLPSPQREPKSVHECMRYSTLDGKRLRPIVTIAVAEMLDCPVERILPTATAIEFIHTHSLILDDLPCMDNDDFRRGRPTAHRVYGESVALLAADALLNLAIAILGANPRLAGVSPEVALEIIHEAGETVGSDGMIGGQMADLSFSAGGNGKASKASTHIMHIHTGKTAKLFRLSARVAGLVAEASGPQLAAVGAFAEHLGLAFQIVDDILDRRGGDGPDRAVAQYEPNFADDIGLREARNEAERVTETALSELARFGERATVLRLAAMYNLVRAH